MDRVPGPNANYIPPNALVVRLNPKYRANTDSSHALSEAPEGFANIHSEFVGVAVGEVLEEYPVTYVGTRQLANLSGRHRWKLWAPDEKSLRSYLCFLPRFKSMITWEHLSSSETSQPTASYKFCMTGREKSRAKPTLIVLTSSAEYGHRLRKAIINQNWWDGLKASLPQIRVAYLHCGTCYFAGPELPQLSLLHFDDTIDSVLTYEGITTYCGAPIVVAAREGYTYRLRPATLGGLIDIGGTKFGITVAHAGWKDCTEAASFDGDPTLYVHASDVEDIADEESLDWHPEVISGPTSTAVTTGLDVTRLSGLGKINFSAPMEIYNSKRQGLTKLGHVHSSSSQFDNDPFDWALVRLNPQSPSICQLNQLNEMVSKAVGPTISRRIGRTRISNALAPKLEKETKVKIVTPSFSYVEGRLIPTPVLLQFGRNTPLLEVFEVTLMDDIKFGDSGSWVINESGQPYGMVFAGVIGSRMAYVLPLSDIMKDIEARLKTSVRLPEARYRNSMTEIASLARTPFTTFVNTVRKWFSDD